MLWLNPSVLFALAASAAPVLIHILIHRRAERVPFPTLRFLQPTRLAAIRRHVLEDIVLLAVRVALLAAAVAASAGPLFVTAARRQSWDRRMVRALVVDAGARGLRAEGASASLAGARIDSVRTEAGGVPPDEPNDVALQQTFTVASLPDGIRRAVLWLETAPPARRELVVSSPFPIGSMTQADVATVPAEVGVRFERTGTLPGTRTVPAGRLLTSGGVRAREVTLAGDQTSVRDDAADDPMVWPIDVVSSKAGQPAIDAAVTAVLSQRVWAAPPARRARLVVVEATTTAAPSPKTDVAQPPSPGFGGHRLGLLDPKTGGGGTSRPAVIDGLSDVSPIQQPWMADAAARIARDGDLRAAAARVAAGLSDARFAAAPWQVLASSADGRPLAVAAGSANRLVVASAARASDAATPVLLRSIANAIVAIPDLQRAEVVPIADALLRQWSRPSARPASPRIETVGRDDRRWLWLAALGLLVLETWIRRARPADISRGHRGEDERVA